MAQCLRIRAPLRFKHSLTRPTFRIRSVKQRVSLIKAAHNDEKNLFIFGKYLYALPTNYQARINGLLSTKIFISLSPPGLGYTGLAAANYFQQRNWNVSGTVRDEEKTDILKLRGFDAYTFHTDGYEQLR
jgi:hypothetical protein